MPNTTLPLKSSERKRIPMYRGVLRYFPAALAEVAQIAQRGNDKHGDTGDDDLYHWRGRSSDHPDCILRHLIDLEEDFGCGKGYDENGVPQVAYLAWRALALAQEWLEEVEEMPLAPAAKQEDSDAD